MSEHSDAAPIDPASLNWHTGSYRERRRKLRRLAEQVRGGTSAAETVAPHILPYIADAAALHDAWDYLERRGGSAPGPDGVAYGDRVEERRWDECRAIGGRILAGDYRTSRERVKELAKASGVGTRPISLMSIRDRVVHRAAACALQPFVEPTLDPHSRGFRVGCDRRHALAAAEIYSFRDGRTAWATADLRDAFQNIRIPRLLNLVRGRFPDPKLMAFLSECLRRTARPGSNTKGLRQGLRQGSGLSPLLMNVYFDHFIDKPWRKRHPGTPLIRYVDDLLILAETPANAAACLADLRELLEPTGLSLKDPAPQGAVCDLGAGERVTWLGYSIRKGQRRLEVSPLDRSFDRLAARLTKTHGGDEPARRAFAAVLGWFAQLGPCFDSADVERNAVYKRVARISRDAGFREIPTPTEALDAWSDAHEDWLDVKRAVAKGFPAVSGDSGEAAGPDRPPASEIEAGDFNFPARATPVAEETMVAETTKAETTKAETTMAETTVRCPMLTEYDLRLANYALGAVGDYRDERDFIEFIAPGLRRTRLHGLIYGGDSIAALRACPMTERELDDLCIAIDSPPTGTRWTWRPYEVLHRNYIDTVPEVRRLATPRMLEDWTADCGRFGDRLSDASLPLEEGLEIVQAWIRILRQLIRACEDQPRKSSREQAEAAFDPCSDFGALPAHLREAIVAIRAAILGQPGWKPGDPAAGKPLGDQATSAQLRRRLSLASKTLSDALCWMNAHGEYAPKGYTSRRNNALRTTGALPPADGR